MPISKNENIKWLIGIGIILSVTFYTYTVEALTDRGYSAPNIMILRGAVALLFGITYSLIKGVSLFPKKWKPQIARFFTNGFASYLSIISFIYLSASTVALVNRLDIPFIIFLSVFTGQRKSNLQFWLSIWTVVIITFLAIDARFIDEEAIGFVYAIVSVFLISIGYLLVKKSSNDENSILICNVFSLSNLVIGIIILYYNGHNLKFSFTDLWILIIGALSQLFIYTLTVTLYRWFNIEKARLPFVISALSIMLLEMIFEHKYFSISQIGLSLIITGLLATIILNPQTPTRKKHDSNS